MMNSEALNRKILAGVGKRSLSPSVIQQQLPSGHPYLKPTPFQPSQIGIQKTSTGGISEATLIPSGICKGVYNRNTPPGPTRRSPTQKLSARAFAQMTLSSEVTVGQHVQSQPSLHSEGPTRNFAPVATPKGEAFDCLGGQRPERDNHHHNVRNTHIHHRPHPHQDIRKWFTIDKRHKGQVIDGSFTVMSYNMLADSLLFDNISLYTHCAPFVLEWPYRRDNLLRELYSYNTDIMCLQEIDRYTDFEQNLADKGYVGKYLGRTGERKDGLAIFYRESMFRLAEYEEVRFKLSESSSATMNRDNVAQIMVLVRRSGNDKEEQDVNTLLEPQQCVCVTNTHLLFNPKRGDIKLAQLGMLLARTDAVMDKLWPNSMAGRSTNHTQAQRQEAALTPREGEGEGRGGCGVIMCGDYNLLPESLLYRFITTGHLSLKTANRTTMSSQVRFSDPWTYEMFGRSTRPPPSHLAITSYPPKELKDRLTMGCKWVEPGDDDCVGEYTEAINKDQDAKPSNENVLTDFNSEVIGSLKENNPTINRHGHGHGRGRGRVVTHSWDLQSAYNHYSKREGEEVTTWHQSMQTTVDYQFYTSRNLQLIARLNLLSRRALGLANGLPNVSLSSDHQPLISCFASRPSLE